MDEIKYSLLAQENIPKLLRSIFIINHETEAHDQRGADESMWRWQYESLPTKNSLVYVASYREEIIGYYHIPVYGIRVGQGIYKIGNIQSVAVLSKFRNQKIFQKLATFANSDADKHVDLIYTFPNQKSIHTFTKYNNFRLVSELPIYVLPLDTSKLIESMVNLLGLQYLIGLLLDMVFGVMAKKLGTKEKLFFMDDITTEVERLFNHFSMKHHLGLIRNKEFLRWRYRDSPKGKYHYVGLESDGNLSAVAILKEENILSSKGLVLMDTAFKDIEQLQKLLTNLNKKFFEERGTFIFVSGLFSGIEKLKMCGFLRVPKIFVPRKLNLLARWTKNPKSEKIFDCSSWLVTLGDWDVF